MASDTKTKREHSDKSCPYVCILTIGLTGISKIDSSGFFFNFLFFTNFHLLFSYFFFVSRVFFSASKKYSCSNYNNKFNLNYSSVYYSMFFIILQWFWLIWVRKSPRNDMPTIRVCCALVVDLVVMLLQHTWTFVSIFAYIFKYSNFSIIKILNYHRFLWLYFKLSSLNFVLEFKIHVLIKIPIWFNLKLISHKTTMKKIFSALNFLRGFSWDFEKCRKGEMYIYEKNEEIYWPQCSKQLENRDWKVFSYSQSHTHTRTRLTHTLYIKCIQKHCRQNAVILRMDTFCYGNMFLFTQLISKE